MQIFRVIGIALIAIGTISGASLLLSPFEDLLLPLGVEVKGSVLAFWLLYLLCFVGGFLLYSLGAKEAPAEKVLKTAGGILLILGVISAFAIFLAKVGMIEAEESGSLWFLFILCTPAGIACVLAAEKTGGKTILELFES